MSSPRVGVSASCPVTIDAAAVAVLCGIGSWSLQFERGSGQVTVRSLLWLGYTFFHVPESRIYGGIYVGNGERNIDLPFML